MNPNFKIEFVIFKDSLNQHSLNKWIIVKLICCNSWTGVNAFFIRKEYSNLFPEVSNQIEDIYIPPFYHIRNIGHPITSNKTIESFFNWMNYLTQIWLSVE